MAESLSPITAAVSLDIVTLNVHLVLPVKQETKLSKPFQSSALSRIGIIDILAVYTQLLLCNNCHGSGNLETKTISKLRSLKCGLQWAWDCLWGLQIQLAMDCVLIANLQTFNLGSQWWMKEGMFIKHWLQQWKRKNNKNGLLVIRF